MSDTESDHDADAQAQQAGPVGGWQLVGHGRWVPVPLPAAAAAAATGEGDEGDEGLNAAARALMQFLPPASRSVPTGFPMQVRPGAKRSRGGEAVADAGLVALPLLRQQQPPMMRPDRQWSAAEDAIIRAEVGRVGERWRVVEAKLTGRSADAVCNRYKRLMEAADKGLSLVPRSGSYKCGKCGQPKLGHTCTGVTVATGSSQPEVNSTKGLGAAHWSAEEDATLTRLVRELGHSWSEIVQQLSGERTENAARNRWWRLKMEMQAVHEQYSAAPAVASPAPVAEVSETLVSEARRSFPEG